MDHSLRPACPVCGLPRREELATLDCGNLDGSDLYRTVRLMACTDCGHVYNDLTAREIEGLASYYDLEYAPANLNSVPAEADRPGSAGRLTLLRYAELYRTLAPHLRPDQAILDVGCALGGFLEFLREKGFTRLCGVDSTETYVAGAKERGGLPVARGSAESLPFADGTFDVVILEQVLEHLVSPVLAFREAARVLRSGGVLCIGVPDASRYADFYFFDYYWLLLREHVQHFDLNALRRLGLRAGFTLAGSRQYSQAVMGAKMVMPNLCAVLTKDDSGCAAAGADAAPLLLPRQMREYLATEAARLAERRLRFAELAESGRPVYVWGAGREFLYLYHCCGLSRCRLGGIVDMNPFKQGASVAGVPVGSPAVLDEAGPEAALLITALAHRDAILEAVPATGFCGAVVEP